MQTSIKTPISYYGGKQTMATLLLKLIPDHKIYCEPFFGGGAVFFRKPPSEHEVINDLNSWVITFYKVMHSDFAMLRRLIIATPPSRKVHREAEFTLKNSAHHDDLKVAWAFWVQTNMSFTACIFKGYGSSRCNSLQRKIRNKKTAFNKYLKMRLNNVDFECNDALKVIQSRDTLDSFFYCDPPYVGTELGHYKGYTETDYENLLNVLSLLKGKFILSSYPSEILEKFVKENGWYQHSITKSIAVSNNVNRKKTEVITANYDITSML